MRSKESDEKKRGTGERVAGTSPLLLPRFYFFALLFTSQRSPLSERLEQAMNYSCCVASTDFLDFKVQLESAVMLFARLLST